MDLTPLLDRDPPRPWEDGPNLPWHEEGFSRRMLREHLDQSHDLASRRSEVIDAQVEWIHGALLEGRQSRILDLGCGPGLYTLRLAERGHTCTGVDIGPASIAYARAQAAEHGAACEYLRADLRTFEPEGEYDLVMLLYGELNAFPAEPAATILGRAAAVLAAEGALLLEPHTYDGVRSQEAPGGTWWAERSGVFADGPHLGLHEAVWHEGSEATARRWTVITAAGDIGVHGSTLQAYDPEGYTGLLQRAGLTRVEFLPGLGDRRQEGLQAVVAAR